MGARGGLELPGEGEERAECGVAMQGIEHGTTGNTVKGTKTASTERTVALGLASVAARSSRLIASGRRGC